ncbi:MAG TPA: hypothetical protein VNM68_11095 [Candidatus Polarisedimenticolia bacterium]|nr:hypothetical protein [Candidatus Polarisedimenticolia bacterium]
MTCPQCKGRVPSLALWTATGLSGIVCPHCHASLCPKALCSIVLFMLSFGLGDIALVVLRQHGAEFWLACLGFLVVCAGVYAVAAPLVRLRLKDDSGPHLAGRRA